MKVNFTLGFSLAPGVGPKGFQKLLAILGTEKAAWEAIGEDFQKAGIGNAAFEKFEKFRKSFNHSVYYEKMAMSKIEFLGFNEDGYPESLKKISDPPIGLFVKGNLKLLDDKNKIAVVGARKITSYGEQVTESLVRDLSNNLFVIVSGMALGIDAIAHKTAIDAGGQTIAVLGCGVDCPFPLENERLYSEIIDSGGLIVSEYPLGAPPNKGTFPARNRIIAGLSKAVLVTEAAEDSGSLITANLAIEQGKTVFAVPGPITSKTSAGTLELIKQGAIPTSSIEDIQKKLNIKSTGKAKKELVLTKDEELIYKILENEDQTVDEISKRTKLPISVLSVILSGMELNGILRNDSGTFSLK